MHDSIFHGLFGGELCGRGAHEGQSLKILGVRLRLVGRVVCTARQLACTELLSPSAKQLASHPIATSITPPSHYPQNSPAGYSFYSHLVSTRMLPLRRLVRWTRTAHTQLGFDTGDRRVLFAASHK